jgi:hypothetical protein
VDDVARVLAITGAPSGQLKLELTESLLVEDMETTIATMDGPARLWRGFFAGRLWHRLFLLSYLKRMPLDQLKIDQSFVRDVLTDPNDAAIVDTIIGLSRSLGLDVIAEGVETPSSAICWPARGCDLLPGLPVQRLAGLPPLLFIHRSAWSRHCCSTGAGISRIASQPDQSRKQEQVVHTTQHGDEVWDQVDGTGLGHHQHAQRLGIPGCLRVPCGKPQRDAVALDALCPGFQTTCQVHRLFRWVGLAAPPFFVPFKALAAARRRFRLFFYGSIYK